MARRYPPTISEVIANFDEKKRVYISAAEQTALIKHLRACSAVREKTRRLCYEFVTCGLFTHQENLKKRANKMIGELQTIEKIKEVNNG